MSIVVNTSEPDCKSKLVTNLKSDQAGDTKGAHFLGLFIFSQGAAARGVLIEIGQAAESENPLLHFVFSDSRWMNTPSLLVSRRIELPPQRRLARGCLVPGPAQPDSGQLPSLSVARGRDISQLAARWGFSCSSRPIEASFRRGRLRCRGGWPRSEARHSQSGTALAFVPTVTSAPKAWMKRRTVRPVGQYRTSRCIRSH